MMQRLLRGDDLRRDDAAFVEEVNAYSGGDIGETVTPTVVRDDAPPQVMGDAEGLRLERTARGWEGIDEAGVPRVLYGVYDDRVGLFLFDAGGTLQVAHEEGGSTLYNSDGTASVLLRDGQIFAYDADGAQVFGVQAGMPGGVGTVDVINAVQRVYRALGISQARTTLITGESFARFVELAEGSHWWGPGTSIASAGDGVGIDWAAPSRLRVRLGGIGTSAEPLYQRPPQLVQTAQTPTTATLTTTTFATVFSGSLTLTLTSNIRISGQFRCVMTLAAARNEAVYARFTVGGVQVGTTIIESGTTGITQMVHGMTVAQNIAAGTYTIVMEARLTNATDSIAIAAGDLWAEAVLS